MQRGAALRRTLGDEKRRPGAGAFRAAQARRTRQRDGREHAARVAEALRRGLVHAGQVRRDPRNAVGGHRQPKALVRRLRKRSKLGSQLAPQRGRAELRVVPRHDHALQRKRGRQGVQGRQRAERSKWAHRSRSHQATPPRRRFAETACTELQRAGERERIVGSGVRHELQLFQSGLHEHFLLRLNDLHGIDESRRHLHQLDGRRDAQRRHARRCEPFCCSRSGGRRSGGRRRCPAHSRRRRRLCCRCRRRLCCRRLCCLGLGSASSCLSGRCFRCLGRGSAGSVLLIRLRLDAPHLRQVSLQRLKALRREHVREHCGRELVQGDALCGQQVAQLVAVQAANALVLSRLRVELHDDRLEVLRREVLAQRNGHAACQRGRASAEA